MCEIVNHYEIVGSFLRPETLKKARAEFDLGNISIEELKQVEDEEIKRLVLKQQKLGIKYISDGEYRRSYWHLDFFWGFRGIKRSIAKQGYVFHGEETKPDSAILIGKIRYNPNHPVFNEFVYLTKLVSPNQIRQSIPAPAQLYAELTREGNEAAIHEYYHSTDELIDDIAKAYRLTILELYRLGCRHLKLDDCTWGLFVDKEFWEHITGSDYDTKEIQELYLDLNNRAIEDLPEDLVITTHVCRGNFHSTWASSGGYEPVGETLFGKKTTDAFFLEFDDERSGDFSPLRFVPDGKHVVLGLVTSKDGTLEDKDTIISRIKEASQYVPLERLSLSPQCGFASTEEGNILTEENQWEKIQLIKDITKEVWGS